jgi:SAM-dependent methyltransferase
MCAACAHKYPIVRGVPRFVGEDAYARSFSYEWNRWNRVQLDDASGGGESEDTFVEKTGLSADDVRGKVVLDVGCGAGRFLDVVSRWGAEAVGVDISFAVEASYANVGAREHVNVVQADVFHLPFRDDAFDVVFSIGVLHHTPDTRAAFNGLPRLLRDGGVIAVWLYHYTDPVYRAASDFWRSIFSRVPSWFAYAWCWLLVAALSPLYRSRAITWPLLRKLPQRIPVSPHPKFHWRVLDTFDWWTPVYQDKTCSPHRVVGWFGECGLRDLDVLTHDTSVRGRRDEQRRYPQFARIMPAAESTRFLVFGGSAGGTAAVRTLDQAGVGGQVIGVCDNDEARHGREVAGHIVRPFAAFPRDRYDFVVIASVTGLKPIGAQLEAAGLVRGVHFGSVEYVTAVALPLHRVVAA